MYCAFYIFIADTFMEFQCYKRILQLDPENVQGLHNLCVVYVERGNLLRAEACLQRAHRLAPNEDYVLRHLNIVQTRINKLQISRDENDATFDDDFREGVDDFDHYSSTFDFDDDSSFRDDDDFENGGSQTTVANHVQKKEEISPDDPLRSSKIHGTASYGNPQHQRSSEIPPHLSGVQKQTKKIYQDPRGIDNSFSPAFIEYPKHGKQRKHLNSHNADLNQFSSS